MKSMINVIRLIKKNMVTLSNISQFKLIASIAITKGNKNLEAVACPNVRIGI
jgi:hypothetical protein